MYYICSMSKKLISLRLESDMDAKLRKFCSKHGKVRYTDAANAAIYHFLSVNEKKQQKYVRNYILRDLGGDTDPDAGDNE